MRRCTRNTAAMATLAILWLLAACEGKTTVDRRSGPALVTPNESGGIASPISGSDNVLPIESASTADPTTTPTPTVTPDGPDTEDVIEESPPTTPHFALQRGIVGLGVIDVNGAKVLDGLMAGHDLDSLTKPRLITVGFRHVCAVDEVGLHCWAGVTGESHKPDEIRNATHLDSYQSHACALHEGGVSCWLPEGGGVDIPGAMPVIDEPKDLAVGRRHACVIDDDEVKCWGLNADGQTNVPAMTSPQAIDASGESTCAIADSGIHCWGKLSFPANWQTLMKNPTMIAVGDEHACVVHDGNQLFCFADGAMTGIPDTFGKILEITAGGDETCYRDPATVVCFDLEGTPRNLAGLDFSIP